MSRQWWHGFKQPKRGQWRVTSGLSGMPGVLDLAGWTLRTLARWCIVGASRLSSFRWGLLGVMAVQLTTCDPRFGTPSGMGNGFGAGGVYSGTIYAGAFYTTGPVEPAINKAISVAAIENCTMVLVPSHMLPYNALLVTFNNAIVMLCEGQAPGQYNLRAYGAAGDGVTDDIAAITAWLIAAGQIGGGANPVGKAKICKAPAGWYRYSAQWIVPKHVHVVGDGFGSSNNTGTWFQALNSFPINTTHVILGEQGATLSFGSRLEDLRLHCNNIAGSIGVDMSTCQENSGLYRVNIDSYASKGVRVSDPGGGQFADNWTIEDCQLWASPSTTGSIGIDISTSHPGAVIRKCTIDATFAAVDQLAGIRITGGSTGLIGVYDINVEKHTDGIQLNGDTGLLLSHFGGLNTSGTNLLNITGRSMVAATGLQRGVGTNTVTSALLGNFTDPFIPYFFASWAANGASGYQAYYCGAAGSATTPHVVSETGNAARFRIQTLTTATNSNERVNLEMVDGNNNGWVTRYDGAGSGNPLEFRPVANNVPSVAALQLRNSSTVRLRRMFVDLATALVAGDFALSAGWGTTAAVSGVQGYDQAWQITVTANGTGIAASPTITLTFKDGTWTNSPICVAQMVGGSGAITQLTQVITPTVDTLTFQGTPGAGLTYVITGMAVGR